MIGTVRTASSRRAGVGLMLMSTAMAGHDPWRCGGISARAAAAAYVVGFTVAIWLLIGPRSVNRS